MTASLPNPTQNPGDQSDIDTSPAEICPESEAQPAPTTALAIADLILTRSGNPHTVDFMASFVVDHGQFTDPETVSEDLQRSGFSVTKQDMLIATVTGAIGYFPPRDLADLSLVESPTISELLAVNNDELNRVAFIAAKTQPLLARLVAPRSEPTLPNIPVHGAAIINTISVASGFDREDIIAATIETLQTLTRGSMSGLLVLHSELDLHEGPETLYRKMSQFLDLRRRRPDLPITLSRDIPALFGIVAALALPGVPLDEDSPIQDLPRSAFTEITTDYALNPEW